MTIDEFVTKYRGQKVEFDGIYPYQCVDLIQIYNRDVIGAPPLSGNAKDLKLNTQVEYYQYYNNDIWYIPPRGSIAVWNEKVGNGNGHCGIVLTSNILKFSSLDQNWPDGRPVTEIMHNYTNVTGFLVPRNQPILLKYNSLVDDLRSITNKYPKY